MKKPTKKQINQQIAALKKMKPRVLRQSLFGDDHHAAIDAQVSVLKNRLTESDVYDRQEECRATECPFHDDDVDYAVENVFEHAREAALWLDGQSEFRLLTDNWKELVDAKPADPFNGILR